MTEPDNPIEHAEIFGRTARAVIDAAHAFAQGVEPTLSPLDSARIYLAAGAHLAAAAVGRAGAVELLRDLAGALEREDDRPARN